MAFSKYWDNNILTDFNMSRKLSNSTFNNGFMCLFEKEFDGRVNRDIAVFAKKNGRKAGLLYNNRAWLSVKRTEKTDKQYEANRIWIIRNVQ